MCLNNYHSLIINLILFPARLFRYKERLRELVYAFRGIPLLLSFCSNLAFKIQTALPPDIRNYSRISSDFVYLITSDIESSLVWTLLISSPKFLSNSPIILTAYLSNVKNITGLESKLMELSKESSNIEPLLDKAVATLSSLDKLYEKANNKIKREIIGSIFPEKSVFDGMHYQTARLNEVVSLIYRLDKSFSENKNGQNHQKIELSGLVTHTVQFSNHFMTDLTRLANLLTV